MYALYGNRFNISLPAPLNTSGTLLPAYHRNVTAGAAWVMPASTFELGARAMSFGLGCFGVPTNSSSIPKATSQPTAAATAYNGTTTLVETVSVKFLSTSALSLQFPETITLASNLAGWSISTTYVFRFSSTIFEATPSTSSILATSSTPPSPLSTASSSTSTERSTLCFDPNLQSPVPCTSPPMPSSLRSSSSSSAPPPYPAATTLHSSANHSTHALNIYYIISSLTLMYLFIRLDFPYKFYIAILWILNAAFRAWMKYRAYVNAHRQEEIDALAAKYGVERQASEKGFWTQIGEVAAYAVVMPVTVGWETVKRIWADWVSEN
ncbi:MAG: hypothetical protein LQ338_004125 [Usnochroma carphineum]|nr:MAG: hypothetical protein LQ338_004125 [Usnochroma carphineum]